jgi:CheY-like chemotaxis protein
MIAVTDSGSGMSADVASRAFEPFFTTKEVGQGTGLGLSQVYGFVRQSGGHVKIYSEPGQGTTVKVYLPRLHAAAAAAADAAADGGAEPAADGWAEDRPVPLPNGAGETVLVVEDDESVRRFTAEALRELGYRVLEAHGAPAALRLLDAHGAEVDLLFTDVVMPEMNGRRLADEALRRRPELKVLFTTGYSRNAIIHNGVLDPGVQLIGKPFTVEELAAKLRTVLEQREEAAARG